MQKLIVFSATAADTTAASYIYLNVSGCLAFYAREINFFIVEKPPRNFSVLPDKVALKKSSYCAKDKLAHLEFDWTGAPAQIAPVTFQ